MAMEFTDANFETEVLKNEKLVFVDFWAPWCGPCQMMSPIVDDLSKELTDVKVGKLNVDENPDTASTYEIMSIPSMKVFKDGKVVKEFIGVQSKDRMKTELAAL